MNRLDGLADVQQEIAMWAARNFGQPGERKPYQPLLGVVEEVGELCHAHLKAEQSIRGSLVEHAAAGQDAVGDVMIYLCDYCTQQGWGIADILEDTWRKVSKRDWRKHPGDGGEKTDSELVPRDVREAFERAEKIRMPRTVDELQLGTVFGPNDPTERKP